MGTGANQVWSTEYLGAIQDQVSSATHHTIYKANKEKSVTLISMGTRWHMGEICTCRTFSLSRPVIRVGFAWHKAPRSEDLQSKEERQEILDSSSTLRLICNAEINIQPTFQLPLHHLTHQNYNHNIIIIALHFHNRTWTLVSHQESVVTRVR